MYTNNQCLVFSHSEDSAGYSACDIKYGDISNNSNFEDPNKPSGTKAPYSSIVSSITSVNIENKIKPNGMAYWFARMKNVTSINTENIVTSNCITIKGAFYYCSKITSLNLSTWDTSKVEDYINAFSSCGKLTSVNYGAKFIKKENAVFYSMFSPRLDNYNICPSWYGKYFSVNVPANGSSDYIEVNNYTSYNWYTLGQSNTYGTSLRIGMYDSNKERLSYGYMQGAGCSWNVPNGPDFQYSNKEVKYFRIDNYSDSQFTVPIYAYLGYNGDNYPGYF